MKIVFTCFFLYVFFFAPKFRPTSFHNKAPWTGHLSFSPAISGFPRCSSDLSGPINRLNAILSLLQPLDRYRTSHPRTGRSSQPPCYSVQNPLKTSAKRKRDRGRDSQPRPRPRLNSQLQGATKLQTLRTRMKKSENGPQRPKKADF